MEENDLYAQLADGGDLQTVSARDVLAFLGAGPAVMIYGAGNLGREVLRLLLARGWNVRGLLDQAARTGQQIDGVCVHAPDDPANDEETRRQTPVVVAIFNPDVELPPVLSRLRALGWHKLLPFVAFHRGFAGELGDRFWLTAPSYYRGLAAPLRAGASLWHDAASRAVYDAVLRHRLTADPAVLPAPDLENQYFPADVPAWSTPARFVDCGAFNGDTVDAICSREIPLEAVAAFEPDTNNLRPLAARLAKLAEAPGAPVTLLWPCAVHASTTFLRFDAGRGAASGFRVDGTAVVQAVALDEALAGFRPTLLKMDIEGAEYDALLGARALIARHRPGLAICVYHRPQDLWAIPQLIQSWNLGYRLYLRAHRHNGFDLVLYAVPPAKGDGTAVGQPTFQ